jgi:hypothetical protein
MLEQPTATLTPSEKGRCGRPGGSFWSELMIRLQLLSMFSIVMSFSSSSSSNSRSFVGIAAAEMVNRCTTDKECQSLIPDYYSDGVDGIPKTLLSSGSVCNMDTGLCTNPFERGCLYNRLPGWNKKRVCNSDDPIDAVELGLCDMPEFDYMEIRIGSGNWETIFFNAWLVQILLSELLGVPTTLEPGVPKIRINFYETTGAVEYGFLQNEKAILNADKYTDCRAVRERNQEILLLDDEEAMIEQYLPCEHYIPEFWSVDGEWAKNSVYNGTIEPTDELGVLARETL